MILSACLLASYHDDNADVPAAMLMAASVTPSLATDLSRLAGHIQLLIRVAFTPHPSFYLVLDRCLAQAASLSHVAASLGQIETDTASCRQKHPMHAHAPAHHGRSLDPLQKSVIGLLLKCCASNRAHVQSAMSRCVHCDCIGG